jgi:hypothetical protein
MLLGLVLGLAIYNAVLLDFPLPGALYRKLLGQAPGLRDLADMSPALGKSLQALLDFDGARARAHLSAHHARPPWRKLLCRPQQWSPSNGGPLTPISLCVCHARPPLWL